MEKFYTSERNIQIVIALMKKHGIKKIIASPGATNVSFVASVQQDPYFEIYSCVDERSAAYMACGMAAESGEAVAISCTGATSSRNYMPGLTEAFYRKLPVLAITSSQHSGKIGSYTPQITDRNCPPSDVATLSVELPSVQAGSEDEWAVELKANEAMLQLKRAGGGPVHINLITTYSMDYSTKELPAVRVIERFTEQDALPAVPEGKTAVFVGAHTAWSEELTQAVDAFCAKYDAVVFCDQTSNYRGKYRVLAALLSCQDQYRSPLAQVHTLIHIGSISGAYLRLAAKNVWRVNPDGEIRDVFKRQRYVFEMEELTFFQKYAEGAAEAKDDYLKACLAEHRQIEERIPQLPLSNLWMAQQSAARVPENSVLHFGILNSLRAWNFFETPKSVRGYCNTGGFGIDGNISSMLGASLANPDALFFGVFGDLLFFYDMNVLCNRNMNANIRILLVNNGKGTEFKNYSSAASQFNEKTDVFIAAAGHNGCQSPDLVRHYAEDLGFEYLTASDKEGFLAAADRFFTPEKTDRPMLLEVFTDSAEESNALKMIRNIEESNESFTQKLAGKGIRAAKKILGK